MVQVGNHRIIRKPLESFTIYVRKPAAQVETATVLTFAGAAPKGGVWLDCDNQNVIHQGAGIGGVMPFSSSNANIAYQVILTLYMEFKGAR